MTRQLGRYEVIEELGQGAMGVVYKATDPLIDRVVAIKTINLSMAMDEKEEYEGRFYQEAKAAGRLNHPNIVTIYDVGKSGDIAYIAMEFLQGRELRDILNENRILPVAQTLDIIAQIASGLAYAHEHDIVHRDIKPSNIMVMRDNHAKITDFGIARMASAAVRTQTGMVLGSPKYMSPEQVMGRALDQRSDIFSLGVMLYEMLTGQSPFSGENVNAIMYQTLNAVPPPPNSLNPAVPEMLNFIVAKALAKGVDDRYQEARGLAEDLRACRDSLPHDQKKAAVSVKPTGERKLLDAVAVTGDFDPESGEAAPPPTRGLSQAFDSAAATMRLAALTTSTEEVDELSKTLKVARPSPEQLKRAEAAAVQRQAPTKPTAVRPKPAGGPSAPIATQPQAAPQTSGLMVVLGVFLLLLILVLAVVF